MAAVQSWRSALLALLLGTPLLAHAAEIPTAPQLRIEAGMHTGSVSSIDTDAQGRWAVTVAADDKTARVWNVSSGQLLQVLRSPMGPNREGELNAVAISPDGAVVAAAGWTGIDWNDGKGQVYLFDRANGRMLQRLAGLPSVVYHLGFSPDGRYLSAVLGGKNGVRVWDWRAGGAPAADTDYGNESYGASWSRDGRLVVSSFDGKLRLYRVTAGGERPGLERLAVAPTPGGKAWYIAFHPTGDRIAVGYSVRPARVDVLDGHSLGLLFSPDVSGVDDHMLNRVAWSADGGMLLASGGASLKAGVNLIRLWTEAGRGRAADVPIIDNTITAAAALHQGGWLVSSAAPAWGILTSQGQWEPLGKPAGADLRDSVKNAFLLGASGAQVQFGYEALGKSPHSFDLASRRLTPGPLTGGQPPDTQSLGVRNWLNTRQPSVGGLMVPLLGYETSRSLAIAPGAAGFVLGTDWALRARKRDGTHLWTRDGPTSWGVNIPTTGPHAGKFVVAAYGDGTIRWHRMIDGQELLAFFPHADRQRWVLWTPSGYYDASPGGEDLIGWHLNRGLDAAADFFPASRFRARFFRPDVIDRVLDTLDETQALALADAARGQRTQAPVSVAQVLPPVVEMMSGAELRASTSQVTVRVRGRSAADAPVTAWRVRVNGQAVADARGLGRVDNADAAQGERELTVPVPPQDSEIQVFAENRHGVSTPALVRVAWAGAAPPPKAEGGFQIQPKLYVLAVGVGAYQHADVNRLAFPAKDARDFAAALQRQKGRLYRDVEVKLLTEAEATADAVVDGLDWLRRQVTQHDLGMVFIAGHGSNDAELGYVYLPVNADPARLRRTSVPMADFKLTLSRLAGKALFFFDTCHSGNVLGGAQGLHSRAGPSDLSGVINDFTSAENGVVVFSSSTGRQLSYENTAWGNGAFTKALVEGLNGAAAYVKGAGRITHKMLDLYISERVKALTDGKQSPVTQAPGGVPDFPVALTAKP